MFIFVSIDTYSGVEGSSTKIYDIPPLSECQIKANSIFERVIFLCFLDLFFFDFIYKRTCIIVFWFLGNSTVYTEIQRTWWRYDIKSGPRAIILRPALLFFHLKHIYSNIKAKIFTHALHPNLASGYGVFILYTQPHTFTFQIHFHTQDICKKKNKMEIKIYSDC